MTLKPKGPLSEAEWGYCAHCKRDVETGLKGRLLPHTRHSQNEISHYREMTCEGSFTIPTEPPDEKGGENAQTASDPVP